jgi:hypothetical protein
MWVYDFSMIFNGCLKKVCGWLWVFHFLSGVCRQVLEV